MYQRFRRSSRLGLTAGALAASAIAPLPLNAAPPEEAPNRLKEAIENIETAANKGDLETVIQYYSSDFSHEDGFDRAQFQQKLNQLWQQYSDLNYETELTSWEESDEGLVATTRTHLTGSQQREERTIRLDATVVSRQVYQDGQITYQETLSEKTHLYSGENPPQVTVNVPETVTVGRSYNFDVIVEEPLREDKLAGTAFDESVLSDKYLQPTSFDLELLPAGGLYKVGRATVVENTYWVSGAIVRGGGITMVNHRIHFRKQ
ncbi:nuclear transport factor 2 family protein [Geitlerinema sp. PCC 9228]|uniref:nuclear transport factor 2 family protein n=1 Tax=Geitlerinema sp. PCC 9228 TaxID=111611 RepID=UPI001114A718|nr:nuclear transport factor 2 family protein [Geitlerinema sp. PCC 9228]